MCFPCGIVFPESSSQGSAERATRKSAYPTMACNVFRRQSLVERRYGFNGNTAFMPHNTMLLRRGAEYLLILYLHSFGTVFPCSFFLLQADQELYYRRNLQ